MSGLMVVIPAVGEVAQETWTGSLRQMQRAVNGLVQIVKFEVAGKQYVMLVNEEGLLIGLQENAVATSLIGGVFPIVGDVAILSGRVTRDGDLRGMTRAETKFLHEAINGVAAKCP